MSAQTRAKRGTKKRRDMDTQVDIEALTDIALELDEGERSANFEKLYKFFEFFSPPTVEGIGNIPQSPVLFVSNHGIMGLDGFILSCVLSRDCGREFRGMMDRAIFNSDRLGSIMANRGAVLGDQGVGARVFAAGKDVLVFPGGAHEANKCVNERYQVLWKERTGFVRLAVENRVPIVPIGIVGTDEWYGRHMERENVADSALGRLLIRLGVSQKFLQSDQFPGIPSGMLGNPFLPKPQRVYIRFGEPVDTGAYWGKKLTEVSKRKIRDLSRQRVEECVAEMLKLQAQDRESVGFIRRILTY